MFGAVIRWLEANKESRENEFHRVLAHVRLPLLSPYFLYDFVENSRYIHSIRVQLMKFPKGNPFT